MARWGESAASAAMIEQLVIAVWVKIFGGMFWYFVVSHPISARSCFSAIFAARVVWFFYFLLVG